MHVLWAVFLFGVSTKGTPGSNCLCTKTPPNKLVSSYLQDLWKTNHTITVFFEKLNWCCKHAILNTALHLGLRVDDYWSCFKGLFTITIYTAGVNNAPNLHSINIKANFCFCIGCLKPWHKQKWNFIDVSGRMQGKWHRGHSSVPAAAQSYLHSVGRRILQSCGGEHSGQVSGPGQERHHRVLCEEPYRGQRK